MAKPRVAKLESKREVKKSDNEAKSNAAFFDKVKVLGEEGRAGLLTSYRKQLECGVAFGKECADNEAFAKEIDANALRTAKAYNPDLSDKSAGVFASELKTFAFPLVSKAAKYDVLEKTIDGGSLYQAALKVNRAINREVKAQDVPAEKRKAPIVTAEFVKEAMAYKAPTSAPKPDKVAAKAVEKFQNALLEFSTATVRKNAKLETSLTAKDMKILRAILADIGLKLAA